MMVCPRCGTQFDASKGACTHCSFVVPLSGPSGLPVHRFPPLHRDISLSDDKASQPRQHQTFEQFAFPGQLNQQQPMEQFAFPGQLNQQQPMEQLAFPGQPNQPPQAQLTGSSSPVGGTGGSLPLPPKKMKNKKKRTALDWLKVVLIPLTLVVLAGLFGVWQTILSFRLSDAQHTNDMNLAQVQQVEANLQTYLDRISELLLNHDLHSDNQQGVNVRILATARTLTILPDLDGSRKAILLKFLHSSGLIGRQNQDPKYVHYIDPIVNLNGADFSGVDFTGFVLGGADLAFVNFSGATLNRADLSSTNLTGANLSGAHLKNANLCFAQVTPQAILRGADLSSALLGGTDLIGADLSNAILNGANLGINDPTCHALQQPNQTLPGATLTNAHLNGANLSNADLNGATVTNTDFTNVTWNHTICPNGKKSDANNPNSC